MELPWCAATDGLPSYSPAEREPYPSIGYPLRFRRWINQVCSVNIAVQYREDLRDGFCIPGPLFGSFVRRKHRLQLFDMFDNSLRFLQDVSREHVDHVVPALPNQIFESGASFALSGRALARNPVHRWRCYPLLQFHGQVIPSQDFLPVCQHRCDLFRSHTPDVQHVVVSPRRFVVRRQVGRIVVDQVASLRWRYFGSRQHDGQMLQGVVRSSAAQR